MTTEDIIQENVKAFALIAYIAQRNSEDPDCPDPKSYAQRAEQSLQNLINYIQNPEETA